MRSRTSALHSVPQETAERFWAFVDRSGDCWLWQGMRLSSGYGRFRVGRAMHLAHRVSYAMVNGALLSGFVVCHHCDNRACVRPDHLMLGTDYDNKTDQMGKAGHLPSRGVGEHFRLIEENRRLRAELAVLKAALGPEVYSAALGRGKRR